MAVYTKINQKEINIINKNFNIEKVISFKGIKQGIENTNYLLKSKKKKYILTIFEKRVLQKEIPFFMKLMDNLNSSKINCPKPLKTKENKYLIKLKNKTAVLFFNLIRYLFSLVFSGLGQFIFELFKLSISFIKKGISFCKTLFSKIVKMYFFFFDLRR